MQYFKTASPTGLLSPISQSNNYNSNKTQNTINYPILSISKTSTESDWHGYYTVFIIIN